jgi:hypothetical protein
MERYIPPAFRLYEFSAEAVEVRVGGNGGGPGGGGRERRWFAHWDGAVDTPAEEVVLAWSRGSATVSVCTSGQQYDVRAARLRAAHLALGGTLLPIRRRPDGPVQVMREMERLRDGDRFWARYAGLVPGADYAEAAACEGYALAYTLFDGGAVFVTAVGVPAERFRIRVAAG